MKFLLTFGSPSGKPYLMSTLFNLICACSMPFEITKAGNVPSISLGLISQNKYAPGGRGWNLFALDICSISDIFGTHTFVPSVIYHTACSWKIQSMSLSFHSWFLAVMVADMNSRSTFEAFFFHHKHQQFQINPFPRDGTLGFLCLF